jgi:3-ketosteroid 9alpha-monooxygenase subunit A
MQTKTVQSLTPYPRGWYLASYSDELKSGEVKSLRLFGRETVLFRDDGGAPHLVDAHCPHLGAHLGHGGKVVGGCIRCPFHGWEFDGASGKCQRLPNGDPVPPRARLERWPIIEERGMILVWYHEAGAPPDWSVGVFPELEDGGWSTWDHAEWRLRACIQDVTENDADVAHSPVMHGFTDKAPELEMDAEGARCTWHMRAEMKLAAFGLRPPLLGRLGVIPESMPSRISVTRWGLSLGWICQELQLPGGLVFRAQSFATTTPIDADHVRLTLRHRIRRTPARPLTAVVLRNYARLFNATVEQDIVIWENKIYRMQPVASRSDWAVLRFRKWTRQFYDPATFDSRAAAES